MSVASLVVAISVFSESVMAGKFLSHMQQHVQNHQLQSSGHSAGEEECPSMFVAIFSKIDNVQQRNAARAEWLTPDSLFGSNTDTSSDSSYSSSVDNTLKLGWSNLIASFAICTGGETPSKKLQDEQDQYGDLLFLDCEEGYNEGLLTKKTIATMYAYRQQYSDQQLFMKVDDDAFVNRHKLCDFIKEHENSKSLKFAYIGVVSPINGAVAKVHREKDSKFYEPPDVYANETYPPSMLGGPGYILGNSLVAKILGKGIAENNLLWNEDKAVGVWVHKLEEHGTHVNWLDVPGTDGYGIWRDHGTWGDYPYILRHNLFGETIGCLVKLELADDPSRTVDNCWNSLDKFDHTAFGL